VCTECRDVACWLLPMLRVYVCVCLFVAHNNETMICAKMAEPIEVPFGMLTVVGLRNIVLGGALDPTRK